MSRKRLFLIDGMSYIYRAYYAIPHLSNSKGSPTNATYGFTTMLRKLVSDEKPDFLGVALDLEGPTIRHEQYEGYKATRKPMPEDLAAQIPDIRRVCDTFRVPVIGHPGYEADDVLGTLARKAVERGVDVFLVTSDKDMLQLVSDHVFVFDPMKDNRILDREGVLEKMGVRPEQVPDLLGLWGDSSDNIPGAPGIGEKGAKELIQTYGTLEECLNHRDEVKRKTYRESLRDNEKLILESRALATIHRDLPLELNLEALGVRAPDHRAAFALFADLEFKSLMREFVAEQYNVPLDGEWLDAAQAAAFLDELSGDSGMFFSLRFRARELGRREAVIAGFCGEKGKAALLDIRAPEASRVWGEAMANPELRKICWDAKLGMLSMASRGIAVSGEVDDVMIMAFLTAPHVGEYTIRRWALDQLHISLEEDKAETETPLPEAGRRRIAQSLCRELDALRQLRDLLHPQLEEIGAGPLYRQIEMPLVPVLAEMERTGIKVDPGTLAALSSEMEEQLSALTRQIHESAGVEFNINSPKQLGEILFERLHLPMLKKTRKTKGYSTDQSVLEELAHSYELPRLILDFRQLAKLKSTYVDALPLLISPETGRVHTSYNQTGAATGRLSSSDPNLQNIPIRTELGRQIRTAFVAEHGNLLLSADYSQVELRVLAHLSGDPVLVDAFRQNQDIHERTAREVFPPEQLENRAECRRRAKVINFGIIYGLSAFGLSQRLGIGREEAQAFIDAYFERYKGVRAWLDRTVEEARRTGIVHTMFGRIRPIPDIKSRNYSVRQFAERTAVNTPIQGTAADIVKIAMIRIQKALNAGSLSAKILLQVHDELVLEVPRGELEQVKRLVKREMENAAELNVPLRVEMGTGESWLDVK